MSTRPGWISQDTPWSQNSEMAGLNLFIPWIGQEACRHTRWLLIGGKHATWNIACGVLTVSIDGSWIVACPGSMQTGLLPATLARALMLRNGKWRKKRFPA